MLIDVDAKVLQYLGSTFILCPHANHTMDKEYLIPLNLDLFLGNMFYK